GSGGARWAHGGGRAGALARSLGLPAHLRPMRVDTGRLRVVETIERSDASPRRKRRPAAAEPQVSEVEPEQRTPGADIHHQRKRKGMSLDQLAVLTKIPRAQLELLEADRYEELPGMVFAKGFLRCCARALELDPDTVLG